MKHSTIEHFPQQIVWCHDCYTYGILRHLNNTYKCTLASEYNIIQLFLSKLRNFYLTHYGRVTHICVSKLTIIGSDNGLSPGRHQAIIWTNTGILLVWTLGTNFSEILGEIHSFSFSKMHLKMSSAKWRLFGLSLNELTNLTFLNVCVYLFVQR